MRYTGLSACDCIDRLFRLCPCAVHDDAGKRQAAETGFLLFKTQYRWHLLSR